MDRFVAIAQIVKIRGIRGEVSAEILTDFPQRFASVKEVQVVCSKSQFQGELERYWFHKGRIILKFRGFNSPEAVSQLIGGEVQIPQTQRFRLPKGSFYDSDLVGCLVLEGQKRLGTVAAIFRTGYLGSNLVVRTSRGEEFMIPWVRKFVLQVDIRNKTLRVKLPPGLVDFS